MASGTLKLTIFRSATFVFFSLFSVMMLYPFMVMLSTSVKSMTDIRAAEAVLIPTRFMFSNYFDAMSRGRWARYFFNSFYITVAAVVASLAINSLAGYSFARLRFRGRDVLFLISLIGIMIPPQVTFLPVFVILKHIPLAGGNNILGQGGTGWINSHAGLVAPYVAGAYGVFLFRQFFLNFPKALDDAATMDGLNRIQAFYKIYVPLSIPVFVTFLTLKCTQTWNDFTWPFILLTSDRLYTVQLALMKFRDDVVVEWHLLMAATTIIVLPLAVVFAATQKQFIRGIATVGIKG